MTLSLFPTIAVWFSCGAASAVAAKLTLDKYQGDYDVRIVNNPVVEEDPDNRRFLHDVEEWLGVRIETATNPDYPFPSAEEVWHRRQYMSDANGAPCTQELKKRVRQIWEKQHRPAWHVLGFTAEEQGRFDRFKLLERDNILPVLIDAGLTKQDCADMLIKAGIAPPRIYLDGYPNANCIGCVKATSPTYWNLVREKHPDVFHRRAVQSRELGAKLVRVNNERIFLDELPADAVGRPLKTMQIDCGLFCEEPEEAA